MASEVAGPAGLELVKILKILPRKTTTAITSKRAASPGPSHFVGSSSTIRNRGMRSVRGPARGARCAWRSAKTSEAFW